MEFLDVLGGCQPQYVNQYELSNQCMLRHDKVLIKSCDHLCQGLILVSAMAGVFKGAGTSIIRPLIISVCKPCSDSGHGHSLTNEITSPNTTTKLCWMASLCWVGILNLPGLRSSSWLCSTVYNCAVLLFLIYRMEIVLNISKLILSQEAANNNQDDGMKKEAENISKENQMKKDE